jgi:hypothetical protein
VEVVPGQDGAGGERPKKRTKAATRAAAAAAAKQQEKHDMLEWVVGELSEALFTELMQGFHAPRT